MPSCTLSCAGGQKLDITFAQFNSPAADTIQILSQALPISLGLWGVRLKKLRTLMGMTVRELGKEFNVGFSSISQWENGEHTIPGSALKLIEIYEQRLPRKK
jgi:DNA-binding transcriptional regulator YiaG